MTILTILLTNLHIKHLSIIVFFLICIIFLIWFGKRFFSDPKLKDFILGSLRDEKTGKGSGKSLTAMMFSIVIAVSAIFAIVYSPSHLLPEYFLISILSFIAALYGIKMVGGKFGNGGGNNNSNDNGNTNDNNNDKVSDISAGGATGLTGTGV